MKDLDKYKDIYVCTCSGKKVYFLDLHQDMICIEDIAHSLSRICRFNGHSSKFYSIAEHSLMTALMVEDRLKIYALLHDAGEAYLSDVSRPLKLIINHCGDDIYNKIEKDILHVINAKFGFSSLSEEDKYKIKLADNTALYVESHYFFSPEMLTGWMYGDMLNPIPSFLKIEDQVKDMDRVKFEFLTRYYEYSKIRKA